MTLPESNWQAARARAHLDGMQHRFASVCLASAVNNRSKKYRHGVINTILLLLIIFL
jgi:hypothetical protein